MRSLRQLAKAGETTRIGYQNRNQQRVLRATRMPGNDHNQRIYELRCEKCGFSYGANGSDIFQRKCPRCQEGAPGLPIDPAPSDSLSGAPWTVADAKARLSEVLEKARTEGPQFITRNGKQTAVVVGVEEWERKNRRKGSLAEFLLSSPLRGAGLDMERLADESRES